MSVDTDVLIIGAGSSGLCLAVQLQRKCRTHSYILVEKSDAVGGTWHQNTYPGCGCDVPSHFYSYSFANNPDWSRKYSMQPEIQKYFESVSDQFHVTPRIRFGSTVDSAVWESSSSTWMATITNHTNKQTYQLRARALVSAVGSLSVPNANTIPGAERFSGPFFHSAEWDHSFDWNGKDVVTIGNGCSATQFVPVMTDSTKSPVKKMTQFSRQAHFLSERQNPYYSNTFKAVMRYTPFAMQLTRARWLTELELDFQGFELEAGAGIREGLKRTNRDYVQKTAPERYWEALIPKYEIGCKRKVLDTDYLAALWRENMELVHDDPIREIVEDGVVTESGRHVRADALVRATGFATHKLLFPMKIVGADGQSLEEHWNEIYQGSPQAYFGTIVPSFPNMFMLMGPNTVTGHLSVLWTVERQVNFILRLLDPIIGPRSKPLAIYNPLRYNPLRLLSSHSHATSVHVSSAATARDSEWTQSRVKRLVWSSGCTSWALDPNTGRNVALYPDWQMFFWWRSVWIKYKDFEYEFLKSDGSRQRRVLVVGGWRALQKAFLRALVLLVLSGLVFRGRGTSVWGLRVEEQLRRLLGPIVQRTRKLVRA